MQRCSIYEIWSFDLCYSTQSRRIKCRQIIFSAKKYSFLWKDRSAFILLYLSNHEPTKIFVLLLRYYCFHYCYCYCYYYHYHHYYYYYSFIRRYNYLVFFLFLFKEKGQLFFRETTRSNGICCKLSIDVASWFAAKRKTKNSDTVFVSCLFTCNIYFVASLFTFTNDVYIHIYIFIYVELCIIIK